MKNLRTASLAGLLPLLAAGCMPAAPPAPAPAPAPNAPVKDDRDDPLVKEALPDTEAVLTDLLAGKYDDDPDLAPVARKVKGYRSWTIDRQERDPDHRTAVNFTGTLTGPTGQATFTASMVKQRNGKWMIGYFMPPQPK